MVVLLFTTGCTDSSPHLGAAAPSASQPAINSNNTVERVEVIHFYGNQQCVSCIAIGDLSEETVNEYFSRELASGKLSFMHINFDNPANKNYVTKYGITGSSLWIGVYDAPSVHL